MVIGKIKPSATLVAQFPAGVEVEAIQHEGRIFMPVVSMGEFAVTGDDDAPSAPARKSEPSAPAAKKDAPAPKSGPATSAATKYTEDELAEMDTKDLLKMCKEMGIDPDATDGKNTNKKLRKLILEAQKNGVKSTPSADDEPEDENEETSEESNDDLTSKVSEILEDFDAGKKNKKKTVAAIVALVDDADEDKVAELVEAFEDDADADIDETAEEIAKALAPKSSKQEKKSPKKGKKDEDALVDVDDLEVGDRVSVFWDDDNQDWFDGEVKSIKKGKVVIAYDDDTEEPIDPEVHTKIKKLAE